MNNTENNPLNKFFENLGNLKIHPIIVIIVLAVIGSQVIHFWRMNMYTDENRCYRLKHTPAVTDLDKMMLQECLIKEGDQHLQ